MVPLGSVSSFCCSTVFCRILTRQVNKDGQKSNDLNRNDPATQIISVRLPTTYTCNGSTKVIEHEGLSTQVQRGYSVEPPMRRTLCD